MTRISQARMDMEGGRLDNVGKMSSQVITNTSGDVNTVTAIALTTNRTLSAAELTDSKMFTVNEAAARSFTTATGTQIATALVGWVVGSGNSFTIANGAAFDVTLLAGVGVTLDPNSKFVCNNGSLTCRIVVNSASAVTIYTEGTRNNKITIQVFTTSGTWTRPAGCFQVRVRVVGGGGGGGSTTTSDDAQAGGGGGGYSERIMTATVFGSSETVTVGAGGAAETSGGTSSFGALLSATGGVGATGYTGVSGGLGSGGDINIGGGGGGAAGADSVIPGGAGGSSVLGGGGHGNNAASTGAAGRPYGGGGAGGVDASGVGGAGAAGVVIVEEFY